MQVDFGRTSEDYARHRAGFPEAFFEKLIREGVFHPGQRVLDLGAGTGTLARGLAKRGGDVTALDLSEPMLDSARRLASEEGLSIDFRVAPAERTGLTPESFGLVTAGTCWHWFDRAAAAREAFRVLAPGGRMVIAHFDWLPLPGNIVQVVHTLIDTFNPSQVAPYVEFGHDAGIYPRWFQDVATAGFTGLESFSFDTVVHYSLEAWMGRVRASAKVGPVLSEDEAARFDVAHAKLLAERFPQTPFAVPHRVFALVATR
ncbi:class I SAM-dependent methyltransferase [Corallococcus exiguus]|uniref:Methyltransferase domain-containing protein n=1 Tax=Corallococcus exiguus TaxID=83462 RepID=A0A7X4YF96_9BACT|nr:class I SAM-dependent methyltransferase [Corallococcus exiguus]NBC43257.1 methyltransferase domain-containing protein [Corallococcus exiguus]TNV53244.1 methyltransferase domain-containing protein [Corallococcus exiguus]